MVDASESIERSSSASIQLPNLVENETVAVCGWQVLGQQMEENPGQHRPGGPEVDLTPSISRQLNASHGDGQSPLTKITIRMYRQSTHTASNRLDSRAANLYEALEASSAGSAWFTRYFSFSSRFRVLKRSSLEFLCGQLKLPASILR